MMVKWLEINFWNINYIFIYLLVWWMIWSISVCVCVYILACTCVCMSVGKYRLGCMCVCVGVSVRFCLGVFMCMSVSVCVCLCVCQTAISNSFQWHANHPLLPLYPSFSPPPLPIFLLPYIHMQEFQQCNILIYLWEFPSKQTEAN